MNDLQFSGQQFETEQYVCSVYVHRILKVKYIGQKRKIV